MKFRDDIDPANTWVVSDTHFGHENIVGFCFRPEDHEQVMIAQWRATVPEDATVLHLGDLSYGHKGGNTRFRRLLSKELPPFTHGEAPTPHKGRKLLIAGNHDNLRYSFYRDCGFKIVSPFKLALSGGINTGGLKLVLPNDFSPTRDNVIEFSHYPSSDPLPENTYRVHGHIHNNGYTRDGFVPYLKQHINVSMEQMRYTPVNLKVLLDAAILGVYSRTTEEQLEEARARRPKQQ